MKMEFTAAKFWIIRLLALGVLLLAAIIETTALIPTLLTGLSLAGLLIAGIAGLFTKRHRATKFCGWLFLSSLTATVVGGVISLDRQQGGQQTADQLVKAIERFRRERGKYPASLDALVPAYLPSLPRPKWGQSANPYFYRQQSNTFTLSYSVGFKVHRAYNPQTKTWDTAD